MDNSDTCECSGTPGLVFPCSGAADVGELADLAARKLTRDGSGQMFCLAGVGGRVKAIMDKTIAAKRITAIDGCPLDCARLTLEGAGIKDFTHVRVTDLGLDKGKSPATAEAVAKVANEVKARLP